MTMESDLLGEPLRPTIDINSMRLYRLADIRDKTTILKSGTLGEHEPGEYHGAIFGDNRTLASFQDQPLPLDDLLPEVIKSRFYTPDAIVYIQKVPGPKTDSHTLPLPFA